MRRQAFETTGEASVATIYAESAQASRILPSHTPVRTFYGRRGKRLLDVALGALLFVALLPVTAVVVLAVLLMSGWPALYSAERVGKGGRSFRVWKFRTMVRGADKVLQRWMETDPDLAAEYERGFKVEDDPRVTALGRFLRRSSLDELPQLWNVIKGDMSLVGPRPIVEAEIAKYGDQAGVLLSVRPGLTGRWQVNGRNHVKYPDRMWVELDYCRSVDLLGDMAILVRTLTAPLRYNGS